MLQKVVLQKVGLPPLADGTLLKTDAYIGGEFSAAAPTRFAVQNPADRVEIAQVVNCTAADTQRAIDAAAKALAPWRAATAKERASVMRRWFELVIAHQEDLAKLMTAEQGKPLAESRGEVVYGASFIEWFAEEAKRAYGDTIPTTASDKRLLVWKEPVGVCAAITPWNFPIAMITRKVSPAIAAGCTVVVKPAEQTPLSALALAELAHRAGLPHQARHRARRRHHAQQCRRRGAGTRPRGGAARHELPEPGRDAARWRADDVDSPVLAIPLEVSASAGARSQGAVLPGRACRVAAVAK